MAQKKKKDTDSNDNTARRKALGKRISECRKKLGYTNALDFSVAKKIPYSLIARYEAGGANITFDNLCKVADACEISVSELTQGV